ncbi:hypothetical protein P171DRAFT_182361 [Karstenula rhodostoma CBS 690.94]|uniref:Uncharacterized protein n=1 Tax=Karstenula rhodostoma CBS 690.94 TaxID=1392251 RepID=A0A9P4P5U0_9PLEO|nr:hypothetical protein P171DRAFT_182361 [Karstenula rhodostoma CBS 690.94]
MHSLSVTELPCLDINLAGTVPEGVHAANTLYRMPSAVLGTTRSKDLTGINQLNTWSYDIPHGPDSAIVAMMWRAAIDLTHGCADRQQFRPNVFCRAPGVNLPVTDPSPGTTVGGSVVAPSSYPVRQGMRFSTSRAARIKRLIEKHDMQAIQTPSLSAGRRLVDKVRICLTTGRKPPLQKVPGIACAVTDRISI